MSSPYLPAVPRGFRDQFPTRPDPEVRPPSLADRVANDFIYSYPNKNTRTNYTRGLNAWFRWCASQHMDPLTGCQGEGIRRSDIERYLRWSEEVAGLARTTVSHAYSSIRGFFRRAMADGYLDKDPTMYVKAPPVERRTTSNALSRLELARIITAARERNARDYAIFCILGYNGLRVSEMCNADVEDLGKDRAYYTLRITRKGGKLDYQTLSQETAWAVVEHLQGRETGPLFQALRAPYRRITPGDMQRLVKRYCKQLGIVKRITPHSFRHTFVTLALNEGVSERDVQRGTGHADGRMVAYYDHGSANRARDATHAVAAAVNELL